MVKPPTIAVFGGSGFLGHKICEVGVRRGYDVTSYSRSGEPPQSVIHQPWVSRVSWVPADIFDPSPQVTAQLQGMDTVVYSIGILFENSGYKKRMNSNFDFLNDVQLLSNAILLRGGAGKNPMRKETERNTYEMLHTTMPVILAEKYIKERHKMEEEEGEGDGKKVGNFVYVSADKTPPVLVPDEYLSTKRQAEFELAGFDELRSLFLRPGAMYDETHEGGLTTRDVLLRGLRAGIGLKECILGEKIGGELVRPVVSTEQVAETMYDKLEDPEFKGVVLLEEIRKRKV
ncbi:MIOREX complex component 2 [Candida viswanathii]|uniref:MIOREX complex component 2 n=1 Tax=Candida viswanathii TaxID=5486 RepID=A0A367YKW1_9ASCO|nr:MIOREX complex component 2 [Candida viswanathii]